MNRVLLLAVEVVVALRASGAPTPLVALGLGPLLVRYGMTCDTLAKLPCPAMAALRQT